MSISATLTQRLVQVAALAAAAGSGGKQAVYRAACQELSISLPTLYRHLAKVTVKPERKQRSDAGAVSLPRAEAALISAFLMVSHRKTNKRLMSIGQALDILRANNEVRAERTDMVTGEVSKLSASAVSRALKHYGLHPDQLGRAAPAVELRSLQPPWPHPLRPVDDDYRRAAAPGSKRGAVPRTAHARARVPQGERHPGSARSPAFASGSVSASSHP